MTQSCGSLPGRCEQVVWLCGGVWQGVRVRAPPGAVMRKLAVLGVEGGGSPGGGGWCRLQA
jgi:hypothetical protein